MTKKKGILSELKGFLRDLKKYADNVGSFQSLTRNERQLAGKMRVKLVYKVGTFKTDIISFTGVEKVPIIVKGRESPADIWLIGLRSRINARTNVALRYCLDVTRQAIGKLKDDIDKGVRDEQGNLIQVEKAPSSTLEPPKAFIAHGPKSEALEKVCRFLTALGIKPLVIEQEPYQSRSPDAQVELHLKEASCAIVLGTADDKELKDGTLYPRRNVHIEIGRFQERFPDKTIYLLQENASFPSNIMEKLHARFTPECMDEALIRVAIELQAFHLIRASEADKE